MTKRPFTVLVEGNIGAGKTSMLQYFASDANIYEEPVKLWQNVGNKHNLLQLLYENPQQWAFPFQSYVMLTALKNHLTPSPLPVKLIERSIFSSQFCFAENFYQKGILHDAQYQILKEWMTLLTTPPIGLTVDLIVYLRIQPKNALARITSRARPEEVNISLSYLQELHECHENWLVYQKFPVPAPVIIIQADQSWPEIQTEYNKYKDYILGKCKLT